LGHFADEGGSLPPMGRRQTHQRSEVRDKRIAVVFEVKFEPLGRKYCCASRRPPVLSCKRQCGALKQKNSADLPVGVAGNPEAFLVAADEKCGDRLVDDRRIERPKLRGNVGGDSTGMSPVRALSAAIAAGESLGACPRKRSELVGRTAIIAVSSVIAMVASLRVQQA